MKFYGLKTCDTCKKAQKALSAAGVSFDVIDVRADGVAEAELQRWLDKVGDEVLVNRRSTTWRGMDEGARAQASGEGAAAPARGEPDADQTAGHCGGRRYPCRLDQGCAGCASMTEWTGYAPRPKFGA